MVKLFYLIFKKHKHKFLNVLKLNHTIILSRGKIDLNFVPEIMLQELDNEESEDEGELVDVLNVQPNPNSPTKSDTIIL
jgi:hypothetical protein